MARPQKEGLDYFPHDVDLSKNDKIEELEIIYGNNGYAVYLKLLERIYKKGDKMDISDAETIQLLSRNCNLNIEKFTKILNMAIKIGLFSSADYEKGILTSDEIKSRANIVFSKREKMQEKYKSRISDVETTPETRQSKGKERKGKKRKEKKSKEKNTMPGTTECRDFFYSEWQKLKKTDYPAAYAKDGATFKWLCNLYPVPMVKALIYCYLSNSDQFFKKMGYSVTGIRQALTTLLEAGAYKRFIGSYAGSKGIDTPETQKRANPCEKQGLEPVDNAVDEIMAGIKPKK